MPDRSQTSSKTGQTSPRQQLMMAVLNTVATAGFLLVAVLGADDWWYPLLAALSAATAIVWWTRFARSRRSASHA